ncbi:MAG: ATP-binding cassette domain-containing protein [Cypionkella sp.]
MNAMTSPNLSILPETPTVTDDYLRIENLWKIYGAFAALRDVSLRIGKGEFICFLGRSGCGKTTLPRAIAGLEPQTHGHILQDGRDISNLPASKRDYGNVFQSYALFPNLTVANNVAFGLENTGRPKAEITKRVAELLELVGLPDKADGYPSQLSGGQQQRIALARSIAIIPGLLLLDGPLSALDAKVRGPRGCAQAQPSASDDFSAGIPRLVLADASAQRGVGRDTASGQFLDERRAAT